jgi:hypothetical protein
MQKLLLTLFLVAFISPAYAGPGHDHGESAFAGGSGPATHFDLTDQQMNNLGIQSAKVEFLPIAQAVDMLAFTELLPEKKASISPRFGGKIIDIAVKVGQEVKKGQRLVTLEAVQFTDFNMIASVGAFGFGLSQLLFVYILFLTLRQPVTAADKSWEGAEGLEWTLPSPAPYHSFDTPPKVD